MPLGVRFGREPSCVRGNWVFGSGENRSASGCSVRARTEVCARKDGYSPDECV